MTAFYELIKDVKVDSVETEEGALQMDSISTTFRHAFHIPRRGQVVPPGKMNELHPILGHGLSTEELDKECIYLCGNSLGLQPKCTRDLINEELDVWATRCGLGCYSFFPEVL
jgi:hypothetical protein